MAETGLFIWFKVHAQRDTSKSCATYLSSSFVLCPCQESPEPLHDYATHAINLLVTMHELGYVPFTHVSMGAIFFNIH